MKLKCFAVLDNATETFNQPFYMLTKAEAIRMFTTAANDANTVMRDNPHDYSLYFFGEWDNISGDHDTKPPENLGSLATFVAQQKVKLEEVS